MSIEAYQLCILIFLLAKSYLVGGFIGFKMGYKNALK